MPTDRAASCTTDELRVVEVLRDGPAVIGPRTEVTTLRPLAPMPWSGAPLKFGDPRPVRTVASRPARSLQSKGWVTIDAGGTVALVPDL